MEASCSSVASHPPPRDARSSDGRTLHLGEERREERRGLDQDTR